MHANHRPAPAHPYTCTHIYTHGREHPELHPRVPPHASAALPGQRPHAHALREVAQGEPVRVCMYMHVHVCICVICVSERLPALPIRTGAIHSHIHIPITPATQREPQAPRPRGGALQPLRPSPQGVQLLRGPYTPLVLLVPACVDGSPCPNPSTHTHTITPTRTAREPYPRGGDHAGAVARPRGVAPPPGA